MLSTNRRKRGLVLDCEHFANLRLKLYIKVNGMKLDHGKLRQNPGVVLYPIYCLINSDCVSNTNYIKTEANLELQARTHSSFVRVCINQCIAGCAQVRAQVAIKAGQEITTRYVSPTLGNCRRRQHLRWATDSYSSSILTWIHMELLLWLLAFR